MNNEPLEQLTQAQEFVKANIILCCQELVEQQRTGILCDGKVRELARMCNFAAPHSLFFAENLVKNGAVRLIAEKELDK